MIQYFTPEQVCFLHRCLIAETGGEHGLRDLGILLSALGRPQPTFERRISTGSPFEGSSADGFTGSNHPFVDGNKRTAITATALFLRRTGYRLVVENDEMVRFTLACAQSQLSLDEIINIEICLFFRSNIYGKAVR